LALPKVKGQNTFKLSEEGKVSLFVTFFLENKLMWRRESGMLKQ